MYISEIPVGADVRIFIFVGVKRLQFESRVLEVEDKDMTRVKEHFICAVVEPVRRDGKLVAMSTGPGIQYSVQAYNFEEEKMYEWVHVKPQTVTLRDGSRFLLLICNDDMKPLNRRKNFRVWLGVDGVVTYGKGQKPLDVVVKDISSGGIAVIARNFQQDLPPNTLIRVGFFDEDTGLNFGINAIVLRREELGRNQTLFACKLERESEKVNQFIKEKERINLRKRNSGNKK